jgi:hypothetical protein
MVIIVDKLNLFETNYINRTIHVQISSYIEVSITEPRKESSCANTRIMTFSADKYEGRHRELEFSPQRIRKKI